MGLVLCEFEISVNRLSEGKDRGQGGKSQGKLKDWGKCLNYSEKFQILSRWCSLRCSR